MKTFFVLLTIMLCVHGFAQKLIRECLVLEQENVVARSISNTGFDFECEKQVTTVNQETCHAIEKQYNKIHTK
jgi:hypothetical protein